VRLACIASNDIMSQRVFIHVPFDRTYKEFFDARVFAMIACGCVPRRALTTGNAAQTRFSTDRYSESP
jgi:hypothetical protein